MSERSESSERALFGGADRDTALERFRTLVDAIDDGLYQLDSDGTFVAVNDWFVETTGYSRARLLDAHASLVFEAGAVGRIEEVLGDRGDEEDLPTVDLTLETVGGDRVRCEVRCAPITEDGQGGGSVGVVRAVRERTDRGGRARTLDRYRTIVETIEDGIYVLDDEYRFTLVNDAYLELTGYSREELLGSHCSLVVGEDVSAATAERAQELVEDDEDAATIEAEIRRRDGRVLRAESRFTPLESPDGTYDGTVGVVRDVEKRDERKRDLERYETIVETIEDGVYVLDEEGTFTTVNRAYADMLGYSPDELVGTHASRIVDTDVHRRAKALEEELVDGDVDDPSIEATVETARGERFPAEATFAVLPGEDGTRERVGVVRDVTERKDRERALEESERRYRTLIDHFPGVVGLYDESYRYTLVGGELVDDFDATREEIVGTSIYERYSDDVVAQVEPHFQAVFEGEMNAFEIRYEGRDLWAQTLPVRNADEEIFAGMLLVQDVTERKEYQRRLEASNERLEQFAYAASHDLQEPLRMVSSYLQLIERRYGDVLDEDGREFLDFAVDGADRMQAMIEGLLAYSRVDVHEDAFEPVDVNDVVDDVLEDLQVTIEETDAEIAIGDLPRVTGDGEQLRRLFQNLLSNAIHYAGDEPPRVTVSAERTDSTWEIAVEDEGIGIEPDEQERIFEVFKRSHGHVDHDGAGIGLALCERIADRHGGDVRVDSTPGEGSTFTVTLPADRE